MANYLSLQTNIPVICTVSQVSIAPGQGTWPDGNTKPDQVVVSGNFEPGGVSKVFLHMALETELQRLGVIGNRQTNNTYVMLRAGVQVRFTKREDGTKKFTTVELVGQGTVPSSSYSQPQTAAAPPQQAPTDKRALWDQMVYTMKCCADEAKKLWPEWTTTPELLASATHTLFIQATQMNLLRTPPQPERQVRPDQLELIGSLCQRLNMEDRALAELLVGRFKCQAPTQLTESNASALIGDLHQDVAKKLASVPATPQYAGEVPF